MVSEPASAVCVFSAWVVDSSFGLSAKTLLSSKFSSLTGKSSSQLAAASATKVTTIIYYNANNCAQKKYKYLYGI